MLSVLYSLSIVTMAIHLLLFFSLDLGINNGTAKKWVLMINMYLHLPHAAYQIWFHDSLHLCSDLHWSQPGEKKLTGGTNWQPKTAPSTTWNPATMVKLWCLHHQTVHIQNTLHLRLIAFKFTILSYTIDHKP